ncbi:MAG: molybdopterin-dependent oxidoreductase [Gammaproteobacteria bacterium]|nr:molybdopterin-dependent oxidoreductase [Gammaproteobacteria bacterium]
MSTSNTTARIEPLEAYPLVSDWLKINSDDTITIYTGRVELGQGISRALVRIATQALSVSSSQIQLISGDTEYSPNEGYTAGSLSISVGGMSIRAAATTAQDLCIHELAVLLSCEPCAISVRDGKFFHNDQLTKYSYGSLAAEVNLSVPITPTDASRKPSLNNDDLDSPLDTDLKNILTGNQFIHDLEFANMLHSRVFLPPHPHAQLSVSTQELERYLPGQVKLVVINRFIAVVSNNEWDVVRTVNKLDNAAHDLWHWPQDTNISGDQIDALDQLPSEELSVLSQSPDKATDAQSLVERPISVSVARPCLLHASIGPSCALAHFYNNKLKVWTHSQGVFFLKGALSKVLHMEENNIRVIHKPGSGCYGHNAADDAAINAALLAKECPNTPVRLFYSRLNECQHGTLGPAMRSSATAWIDLNGNLNKVQIGVTSPPHSSRPKGRDNPNAHAEALLSENVSKDTHMPFVFSDVPLPSGGSTRNAIPEYTIPDFELTHKKITQLPYRASSLRSLGAFTNVLAIESLMDECALTTHCDPITYRLKHLKDPRSKAVIDSVVLQSEWDGIKPGFGLAYSRYKNSAAYCACIVQLSIDEDILVKSIWIAADVGEVIDHEGVRAQLEGGAIQAVSWMLLEQVELVDSRIGVSGWEDYSILRFGQVPSVDTQILSSTAAQPLGCGEAAQAPVGAAVLNAVRSLLGFRPSRLPLTRESLIEQMKAD